MDIVNSITVTEVRCPACGADVPSTTRFCRNCGTQMPGQGICPHCRTPIYGNPEFCRNCGKSLIPKQKCPNCNSPISGNPEFCRNCGVSLPASQPCPACGAIVSKTAKICNECGKVMDADRDLEMLKQYKLRIYELKRSYQTGDLDPAISQHIANIESQLQDPHNISGVDQKIEAIEREIQDQQKKDKEQKEVEQEFTSVQKRAHALKRNASGITVAQIFAEISAQISDRKYVEARSSINIAQKYIDTLLNLESSITSWKLEGYNTIPLEEMLPVEPIDNRIGAGFVMINKNEPVDPEFLSIFFTNYRDRITTLNKIGHDLKEMENLSPDFFRQPQYAKRYSFINQNLKDPVKVGEVDSEYQHIKMAFQDYLKTQSRIVRSIQDQINIIENHTNSSSTRMDLLLISTNLRKGEINQAQDLFHKLAGDKQSCVQKVISDLENQGAVIGVSTTSLQQFINEGKFGEAVIESERLTDQLTKFSKLYSDAKIQRTTVIEPEILALFENGKYEEFIHASEERQKLIKKVTELKENGRELLVEAEQFCQVPEHIRLKLEAQDIPTIESAIKELEMFRTTAKPDLTLTLDHTQLNADDWDRMTIQLANRGNAHAKDVRLTFSDKFDTERIKTTTINAGVTTSLDIGIRPKVKGKIPLDVTTIYNSGIDKKYSEIHEFWIDVLPHHYTPHIFDPETDMKQQENPYTSQPPRVKRTDSIRNLFPEMAEKYLESEFIGKGGFGCVYKVKRRDGAVVAIKLPINFDESTGKSFLTEIQNWTKFNHPNIVKIFDYNALPHLFVEEELCDSSLDKERKPLDCKKAVWILNQVCDGLKYAHARNVIHRDLKPANILLKNGIPKISDWGLSKNVTELSLLSTNTYTPSYAAPEQIRNKAKDQRTDVWQVGVILYELVTGSLPFTGDNMLEISENISTTNPVPPGNINPEAKKIEPVILRCMEKDPVKRYQSIAELQKDLAGFLKIDYEESRTMNIGAKNLRDSAYCSTLLITYLKNGDLHEAYKYATDLINYSKGEVRDQVKELSEQIRFRIDNNIQDEVPDEIIAAADLIAHKIGVGFTTM